MVKAVLWSWSPLATGEPEAAAYERKVYHTAEPAMSRIVAIALLSGLLFWLAMAVPRGGGWCVAAGIVAMVAAIVLDVRDWERVAASAGSLWFQRGYRGTVHQIVYENIHDVTVDESQARAPTLRGLEAPIARLTIRTADKRVVALPKTDARNNLEQVEAVANHVRQRLDQLTQRQALKQSSAKASRAAAAVAAETPRKDDDLRVALARLRAKSASPDLPPMAKTPRTKRSER